MRTMIRLQSRGSGHRAGRHRFRRAHRGLTGAVSASAATLNDGGYTSGGVHKHHRHQRKPGRHLSRQANGTLTSAGTYNTSGTGTSAGGFFQGAVTLSRTTCHPGKGGGEAEPGTTPGRADAR